MKRIIYTAADGSLSIMSPAPEARFADESEDEFLARIAHKDVPADATDVRILDEEVIPIDRTFRNAWEFDGKSLGVNMTKARGIHRDRLRSIRAPLLSALDTGYMRADEAGDDASKKRIAARKQALRDVTIDPRIDAATTPDELKAAVPDVLTS